MLGKNAGPSGQRDSAVERRRGQRFPLRLPCRVTAAFRETSEWTGSTNDISRSGVRVLLVNVAYPGKLPRLGESVRVLIDLPHSANIAPRCLECMGTAVRKVPGENQELLLAIEIRIRVCDQKGKTYQPGDSPLASVLLRRPAQ